MTPAACWPTAAATDWATGGHTNLDTMTITCGYHNTQAPKMRWHTIMINGIPHWQPHQQPLPNYLHHPELLRPPVDQSTKGSRSVMQ
jgi:hypothetical protein